MRQYSTLEIEKIRLKRVIRDKDTPRHQVEYKQNVGYLVERIRQQKQGYTKVKQPEHIKTVILRALTYIKEKEANETDTNQKSTDAAQNPHQYQERNEK